VISDQDLRTKDLEARVTPAFLAGSHHALNGFLVPPLKPDRLGFLDPRLKPRVRFPSPA